MIKAIETTYKGYRFRSRLEARWAVFFDEIGLSWRYEHQGYERGSDRYLPDFELTIDDGKVFFVEVKGDKEALVKDYARFSRLLDFGGCLPEFEDSAQSHKTGLILLGDVPDASQFGTIFHPIIQHHKGLHRNWCTFTSDCVYVHSTGVNRDVLAHLFDLESEACIEGEGKNWLVEHRFVPTSFAFTKARNAYIAARQSRFEHGQIGALA